MSERGFVHRMLHQWLHHTEFGYWLGVALVVFGAATSLLTLTLRLMDMYAHPRVQPTGIDPLTVLMLEVVVLGFIAYLLKGLHRKAVWATLGLVVAVPLAYALVADSLVAAIVSDPAYDLNNWGKSWWLEVVPASGLVVVYGVQALGVARERVRRVRG
jgi:hypothetical protein